MTHQGKIVTLLTGLLTLMGCAANIALPLNLLAGVTFAKVSTSTPAPTASPILQTDTRRAATPPAVAASSPLFERVVNLGVPVGNGAAPRHLALNSAAGRVYILSEGLPSLQQGNGLSVYSLKTDSFVAHAKINQGSPTPLDLQFDPAAGLLYALTQPRYDLPPVLSALNPQTLRVTQEISGVYAFAAAGQLYTAADQLTTWTVEAGRLTKGQHVPLTPTTAWGPLAVNPATRRLYLARSTDSGWTIEIFDTATLAPLGRYAIPDPVLNILPHPTAAEIFVVTQNSTDRLFYRLPSQPDAADPPPLPPPYRLGPAYNANGLAISPDGQEFYFGNGELYPTNPTPGDTTGPALIGLSTANLSPRRRVPLLTSFDDLVMDAATNRVLAVYPYDDLLYSINLAANSVQPVYTAIEIRDVLVNAAAGELYISDSSQRVRRLNAASLAVLAERRLNLTPTTMHSFNYTFGAGELSLDPSRPRLYASGSPAYVFDAATLALTAVITTGGQFAPNTDRVYLSNCGVTILNAATLTGVTLLPGSGPRADQFAPNPCVAYSQLDPVNHLLYSLAPNGVPGSNGGSYLYVYDLTAAPRLIFTDTNISFTQAAPDPIHRQAFVSYIRMGQRRLRALSAPGGYTRQLFGVWGEVEYSPHTNRLYLSDSYRLLVLAADTLDVIAAMPLPPAYNYRLVALDPNHNDRLYLAGYDGQLLIANGLGDGSPQSNLDVLRTTSAPTPRGAILSLDRAANGHLLARISVDPTFTDPRLFLSTNEGRTWLDLNFNLPPFPVQAAVLSPRYVTDHTMWAAAVLPGNAGGLYRSTDSGQTWTTAMTGLRSTWPTQLFISPEFGPGLVIADTTDAGLHVSTDNGETWRPMLELDPNQPFAASFNAAAISARGDILASQSFKGMEGVFLTTVSPTGDLVFPRKVLNTPLNRLAFAPNNRLAFGFGAGLWRSTDGGQTWQPGGAGLTDLDKIVPNRFLFSPHFSADQTLYLFFTDLRGEDSGRLFRSTDAGQTWQRWAGPPNGKRITAVTLDPANGDLLLGDSAAGVTRLSPAQIKWISASAQPVVTDLAVSPDYNRDHTLFAVSHQAGLFKSTDGGQKWQLTGFPARSTSYEGYRLAISPAYPQDSTLYAATGFSLHRSADGGQTWQHLSLPDGLNLRAEIMALSPHFAADQTLLVSTPDGLLRSTNRGDTWQPVLSQPDAAGPARILAFDLAGQVVYAWFDYAQTFYVSQDNGQTWTERPAQPDAFYTVAAAVVAPNHNLTIAPDMPAHLLQVSNLGQNWRVLSESLPPALNTVQTMAYSDDNTLLIGGQGGLFASRDNGQTWQPLNTGLPSDAAITRLRLVGTDRFIALDDGRLFTSTDTGALWQEISVK